MRGEDIPFSELCDKCREIMQSRAINKLGCDVKAFHRIFIKREHVYLAISVFSTIAMILLILERFGKL
jgi:hypothetical protein